MAQHPGLVILLGSGETSASGRTVWNWLFRQFTPPLQVSILETPAGFQPNTQLVATKVGDFLKARLQNHQPQIHIVPARKRGTAYSPDDPSVVEPMLNSDVLFLGPGSPTYAVRQLADSAAWHTLIARHRLGAAVVMASAATIASSQYALPVYEIFKAGDDLHWCPGLDFFKAYGLSLVFVSHWDNNEGGAELDTSRCFMGRDRFRHLRSLLPSGPTIVGIDEHTALVLNLKEKICHVMGRGGVTLLRSDEEQIIHHGESFAVGQLGEYRPPPPETDVPEEIWQRALSARAERAPSEPPEEVLSWLQLREEARSRRDWRRADEIRAKIESQGWQVRDTPRGPELEQQ